MHKQYMTSIIAAMAVNIAMAATPQLHIASPGGTNEISFRLASDTTASGAGLRYDVTYKGRPVVTDSRAGLDLDNRVWEMALGMRSLPQYDCWMQAFTIDSVSPVTSHSAEWTPLYGERSKVTDNYNAATIYLSKKDKSDYRLNVEARAYDEGVAFRYFLPEHPKAVFHKVTADLTEYTFPDGVMAWSEQWAQAPFERLAIDSISHPVERALTIEYPEGYWAAITDADVDDWCLTKLDRNPQRANTLSSVMYSPVDVVTYYATPWKVIITADTPGGLLENNDIILNLNPPCEIADAPQWVKPGTIMRETTISTEGALATIDFCAEHNIPYMLFDWKWYEPCTSHDGDARIVVDKLDMPKVVAYGKEKGVGIWVYVNQHALQKQMREIFPMLHQWGIVGVKSGFVQYASHRWATWLHDMVRLAAENHLLINIHDEFHPSGFSRTYPNLLTQEGIHGNEEWPDATHNVTLPFTRMINGAADYTICYYDRRLRNTHAHQLAASLVMYSPLQTILWYDTPSRSNNEPELAWFEGLKTVWDESHVLDGYPGKGITMARRNGDEWWVGAMTNNDGDTRSIELSFLDPDRQYVAETYTDDPSVDTATKVRCGEWIVKASDTMRFDLSPRGGAAIHLRPLLSSETKKIKKYKGRTL